MVNPDVASVAAERLVAVTGLFPARTLGVAQADAAEALPRAWARRVRDFLDAARPTRFRWPASPPHEATLDRLVTGIAPEESSRLIRKAGDADIAQAYLSQLSNAREYVRSIWPALSLDTPTGPRLLEPGPDTMGRAASVYHVVDRPERVLDELCYHTLLPDQVVAFKTVYPRLYDLLRGLVQQGIDRRAAHRKSYTVPWAQERVLRVFLQLPSGSPIARVTQAPARMTAPSAPLNLDFSGQQTKAQRLDAR